MKTWQLELFVVGLVLFAIAATIGGRVELVGALAVTLSFGHAQVADRLAEREAARDRPAVDCHRWATRYLVGKEAVWLVYFVALHAWSALAGVGLFLAYPVWRRWYRRRHPFVDAQKIEDEAAWKAFVEAEHAAERKTVERREELDRLDRDARWISSQRHDD